MSEVIVVTSGKGGVGKTTTTANIGTGLAKLGKNVVMIDTDTGLRNLDVVLGLENRIVYNLVDVVEGNCRIKQALISDKRCPKLYLLPTAQTRDKSAVTPEQMIKVIDELKADPEGFDYIILDTPPILPVTDSKLLAIKADATVLVVRSEISKSKHVSQAFKELGKVNANVIGTILNDVEVHSERLYYNNPTKSKKSKIYSLRKLIKI